MMKHKKQLISFADDQTLGFVLLHPHGGDDVLETYPIQDFLEDERLAIKQSDEMAKAIYHVLVVPDYWVGNRLDAFQSSKKSVIAAFIERKIGQNLSDLPHASDFYGYTLVHDSDQRSELYTCYLQEPIVYQLHRRLETLGIQPRRITTPAFLWHDRLSGIIDGFDQKGIGLLHQVGTKCFLYLFFRRQFLFSRTIQLSETGQGTDEAIQLLNYEINQSLYHYSQKTKSAVDELFFFGLDSQAAPRLSEALGKEVQELVGLSADDGLESAEIPASCRSFSADELAHVDPLSITHKPLAQELFWKPVQWAGIAIGLLLVLLLSAESAILHAWTTATHQEIKEINSRSDQPPAMVFQETSMALGEIRQAFERPTAGNAMLQTLLAVPDGIIIDTIALDVSTATPLSIRADVHANGPDTFRTRLRSFLSGLNERLSPTGGTLNEKDVRITIDRSVGKTKHPVYRIEVNLGISS